MIINNNLYCVIYTLCIKKLDSVIPEELIYDFILCYNEEEYYFLAINSNTDNLYVPYMIMGETEDITKILKKVTLLTRFTKFTDIHEAIKPSIRLNLDKDYYIYTLNDFITIGEKIDLKKYSYKIIKNFKPVTFHIDIDNNRPVRIDLTKED